MSDLSKPSKGAEKILLAQIKQEFSAPAEAIEHYLDLVEQYAKENNLNVTDELNQIKEAEKKLLSQYEEAFNDNTSLNNEKKSSEEYSILRHNLRTPLNAIIGYSEILIEDFEDDFSQEIIDDLNTILNLSRDTEKAITAKDGKEGLKKLDQSPTLIVLDLEMPRMDGFEFLEKFVTMEFKSKPNVIVYSGKDLTEVQEDLLKTNVEGLLKKDEVSINQLPNLISKVLKD